jgi:hypothetical protein
LRNFEQLLRELKQIAEVTKGRETFEIDLTPAGEDWF